jgi:hypothetical protein
MRVRRIVIEVEVPYARTDGVDKELLSIVIEAMKVISARQNPQYPSQAQAYWDISENERIGDVKQWPPSGARSHRVKAPAVLSSATDGW